MSRGDRRKLAEKFANLLEENPKMHALFEKGRRTMSFGKDDILDALGLQTAGPGNWIAPAAVGFGVGALIGATIALMMAPRAGTELREELRERGRRMVQRGRETVEEFTTSGRNTPTT